MRKSHFAVYQDAAGEFRWRFVASNGKIIADSGEGYDSRSHCIRAIETLPKKLTAGAWYIK